MDVRCEKCGTEYEFDENRIGANGVTVKCTACGFVFKVRRPRSPPPRVTTTIGKGPQGGKEWLVRKPDGQMIAFRELTTLQKWIVEGRIGRDDEISKNGETWKRLGNIMELEPFFSVYEKARTLNTLMDQSALELRGSEVLSAANPIPQPQPLSAPSIPTIPASYSSGAGGIPAVRGQMPIPPAISTTVPIPLSRSMPAQEAHGNGRNGPAHAPDNHRETADLPRPRVSNHHRPPQPAAIPDLSIRIDEQREDTSKSDIVSRFERSQRRKAVGWVMLFVVMAGAGGVAAYAIYGPKDNALKALAMEHGILPTHPVDDGAMRLVEEAQASIDLDTMASLQKAAVLLEKAASIRKDPVIEAERALVLAMQAGSYRRWATDLELQAQQAEQKKADPKPLRGEAEEKAKLVLPLLEEAHTAAAAAQAAAPDAPEPARALASYHLIQKDEAACTQAIDKAKAGIEKTGRVDPVLLYLEAGAALKDPANPDRAGLERAKGLLDQAITLRPTMNAGHVLVARIHLANEAPVDALAALDKVLAAAPAHEEALRLKEAAALMEKAVAEKKAAPPPPPPPPAKVDPDAIAAEHPDTFEWWMARAESLRERDRTKAALDAYGRAAELSPGSAEPHTGKGWCFLDIDRPHLALASFDRALKANSRYAMAYYGKAESYRALGETAQAIEAFEEFIARAPENSPDRDTAQKVLDRLRSDP